MVSEDTTTFVDGKCQRCGDDSHTLSDGGEYCDACARRVVRWVVRWDELAMSGAFDG